MTEIPYSLAGRDILGRSTPWYDERIRSQPIYEREEQMPMDHTMAPPETVVDYYGQPLTEEQRMARHYARFGTTDLPPRGTGGGNPDGGRYGEPLTEEQRRERHYALYGNENLPPRGTGGGNIAGRSGQPLTDEERQAQHFAQFGTTDLPPRGTGLAGNPGVSYGAGVQRLQGFDWGSFFIGGILAFVGAYFVFTASGRKIGYRVGERVARRI